MKIFSQSATDTSKICFPYPIAKKIVKDLIKGDSAQAELASANRIIKLKDEKIKFQDTTIKIYEKKDSLSKIQIKTEQSKTKIYSDSTKVLNKQLKKQVRKTKTVGGIGLTLLLLALIL